MTEDAPAPAAAAPATAAPPSEPPRSAGGPLIEWAERQPQLKQVADRIGKLADRVVADGRQPLLRGEWLGHPVHPAMTDVPIGCWTSALVLDLLGGRRSRSAATMLVGLGVLSAVPTVVTGLAEFTGLDDDRTRRVAAAHAGGNAAATALYAMSWLARRRRHHLRGVMWALAGTTVATAAGYLGGHLAFGVNEG